MTMALGFRGVCSACVLVLYAFCCVLKVEATQKASDLIDQARKLLAVKQYDEALRLYGDAISLEPGSYMPYFQRATAYLAVGVSKSALADLNKVIELRPDFSHAIIKAGELHLKMGSLDDAEKTLSTINDADAAYLLHDVAKARETSAHGLAAAKKGNLHEAETYLSKAIEICGADVSLRHARADVRIQLGLIGEAIHDVSRAVKMTNDDVAGYLKLSLLYYQTGDAEKSLNEIRECLKLDPDEKACFKHYKMIKKLHKMVIGIDTAVAEDRHTDAIEKTLKAVDTVGDHAAFNALFSKRLCKAYKKNKSAKEAVISCTKAIKLDELDTSLLFDRAEAYILLDDLDHAEHDYQTILESDKQNREAQEGQQRVQQLRKQAKKRNYYKILGVPRNAKKKEILKAYRKLALEFHPDKFEGEDEVEREAHKKRFMDIADAKEVLSDPEMRKQFDQGIDPLDNEQEQGHRGGPQWGGHPFFHQQRNSHQHFYQESGGQKGGSFKFRWG
eukprot:CFRG3507T1